MDIMSLGLAAAGVAAGLGAGFTIKRGSDGKKLKSADEQAQTILAKAKEHLQTAEHQARNRARNIEQAAQQEAAKDAKRRENEARDADRRVKEKETQLEQKLSQAELRDKKLKETEERLQNTEKKVTETLDQVKIKLEHTSNMSQEEAKKILVDTMEGEARHDAARLIKVIEDEAKH